MKTVLTKTELADRWGVDSRTIDKWEREKIIKRVDGIPTPRYSIKTIEEIELGTELNEFSRFDKKRLENEIKKLRIENEDLKNVISNILAESSKVISFIKK
ncbi:MAG: histidine kinase [Fusobacterium necrophorum]|nr:histidine kinase [Fusobacterium necrophorum]